MGAMPRTPVVVPHAVAARVRRRLRTRAGAGAPALVLALVLAVGLGACGSDQASPSSTAAGLTAPEGGAPTTGTSMPTGDPVTKEVLATDVDPPGAPGYTLTLIRYTIAAGAKLAPHVHPGVQMAAIDSGQLTYTVISGTAQVRRAGSDQAEPLVGPATTTLEPGDSVVEPFDMVHFGANDFGTPVVITATLLTETDLGLSVAVTTTTAPS